MNPKKQPFYNVRYVVAKTLKIKTKNAMDERLFDVWVE